jgi:hypothetical protein
MVVKQMQSFASTNDDVANVVRDQVALQQSIRSSMLKSTQLASPGRAAFCRRFDAGAGVGLGGSPGGSSERRSERRSNGEGGGGEDRLGELPAAERRSFGDRRTVADLTEGSVSPGGGARRFGLKAVLSHSKEISKVMRVAEVSAKVEDKAQRMLLSARAFNVLTTFLWQAKAMAVMLVGTGVKIAMSNPFSKAVGGPALQLRYLIGLSVAVTFGVQYANSFLRSRHHYTASVLPKHPKHALVLAARLASLGAGVAVCQLPLQPLYLLCAQAGLAVLQCALLHAQEHRFPISSSNKPSGADLPTGLHALRMKAQRARMGSVPRGCIGRTSRAEGGCPFGGGAMPGIPRLPGARLRAFTHAGAAGGGGGGGGNPAAGAAPSGTTNRWSRDRRSSVESTASKPGAARSTSSSLSSSYSRSRLTSLASLWASRMASPIASQRASQAEGARGGMPKQRRSNSLESPEKNRWSGRDSGAAPDGPAAGEPNGAIGSGGGAQRPHKIQPRRAGSVILPRRQGANTQTGSSPTIPGLNSAPTQRKLEQLAALRSGGGGQLAPDAECLAA